MIETFDWIVMGLLGVGSAEGFLWLAAARLRFEEKPGLGEFLMLKGMCLVGGAMVAALFYLLMGGSDRLAPAVPASLGALGMTIGILLVLALNWRLWQKGLARPRKEE